MGTLQDKIALITGGSSGIGRATAQQFVAQGAKVVIAGRNPETLASIKAELGDSVITVQGDVRNAGNRKDLLDAVKQFGDHLDILFANAGAGSPAPVELVSEESAKELFDVNLWSIYFLIQDSLPLLLSGSSIIVTSSVAARISMPGMSVYSASKAALTSIAQSYAVELAGKGIRVNTISPGPITTPILGRMGLSQEQLDGFVDTVRQRVPLGRLGTADEVASLALYLAGDTSTFITGADFTVDGGLLAA
jgi:NAD(P)-dependent dehydrogenase (short-subunit alcohol dehydrogenase family)